MYKRKRNSYWNVFRASNIEILLMGRTSSELIPDSVFSEQINVGITHRNIANYHKQTTINIEILLSYTHKYQY